MLGPWIRRRTILTICAGLAISLAGLCSLHAAESKRPPNIVFILADDVGVETIGAYGGQSYATPRIDALAKRGLQYRYGFSMPVCHPTRITFLTGRYPFRLGHPGWGSFPQQEETHTVAHLLQSAGYATAIAGKWQLTLMKKDPLHPQRLGFQESCLFGWHEGPRYYQPMIYQNGKVRDDVSDRYGPDVYTEFLIEFMKKHREQPFFAFYSMALCHDVTDDLKEPVPFGPEGHYDTYHMMMEQMDVHVGRIADAIDSLDLADNTYIVFTGDNGTPVSYLHTAVDGKYVRKPVFSQRNGEKIRGGKGSLTDAGTNVPLIVVGPQVKQAEVDDLVDMSDYLATFAQLAGVKVPTEWRVDSRSFASRLGDYSAPGRSWAFAEGRGGDAWVRTARYKLYKSGKFFDLAEDPTEKQPLTAPGKEAMAEKQRLQAELDDLFAAP